MTTLPFNVIFDGKEGERASLRTAGGHAFTMPASHVPGHCVPGDSFCLDLDLAGSATLETTERLAMAKAVLNELLRTA